MPRLSTLLLLSVIPACATTPTVDELAGDAATETTTDDKADAATTGAYTYFEIRSDLRKCAAPTCGGYFLGKLNSSTTKCHDGSTSTACYTPVLDWSEASLSTDQQAKLLDAAYVDATTPGVTSIVRGRFAKTNSTTPRPSLGRFIVTEAWLREGTGESAGVFVKAYDAGIRCITAPCPSTKETALNTSRTAIIGEIDWSAAGLTDREIEGFQTSLFDPSGILFAGDRYTATENGHAFKARTATAAYHRITDAVATE